MKLNPITLHDGYKLDHRRQFPKGLEYMQSNFTPRSSRRDSTHVVFGGLQYYIKRHLMEDLSNRFFNVPLKEVLAKFVQRKDSYSPGNTIDTEHIENLWRLGYLPLKFSAFPEGTRVPIKLPMVLVENTHPEFAWLVNFYETLMSSVLWPICTSATTAYNYRILLDSLAKSTGYEKEFVPWQAHDFSFRGMMGPEAACLSGLGHLFSFYGTDSIPTLDLVDLYYQGDNGILGGGVPATEHAVMCAGGAENEYQTIERLLNLYTNGIVSIVSDTWDLWKLVTEILPLHKERIMSRDGKVVIRPDSGDPVDILCGNESSAHPHAKLGVVELLWNLFGGTLTSKGFKQLDSHIGVIYGDSITLDRAKAIADRLTKKGFCPTVVFGIGSYTYQYVTRDTEGFAMKATWAQINGESHNLFKKPITDDGTKFSAKGRLAVDSNFNLIQCATPADEASSLLTPVWENGKFHRVETLKSIRNRLHPEWVA